VIVVLETLSQKFEPRNCALWMIVTLVGAGKRDLLLKADSEDLTSIYELALARSLTGIVPSESEVERTTPTQRSIVRTNGPQFGQRLFADRTQIHQSNETSLVQEKRK
jgi:hypothetical protein